MLHISFLVWSFDLLAAIFPPKAANGLSRRWRCFLSTEDTLRTLESVNKADSDSDLIAGVFLKCGVLSRGHCTSATNWGFKTTSATWNSFPVHHFTSSPGIMTENSFSVEKATSPNQQQAGFKLLTRCHNVHQNQGWRNNEDRLHGSVWYWQYFWLQVLSFYC